MKNNELLAAILEELQQLNGTPKPVGLVPPTYIKNLLTNSDTCDETLYSYTEAHRNVIHRCGLNKGHKNAHVTRVYGISIKWYIK